MECSYCLEMAESDLEEKRRRHSEGFWKPVELVRTLLLFNTIFPSETQKAWSGFPCCKVKKTKQTSSKQRRPCCMCAVVRKRFHSVRSFKILLNAYFPFHSSAITLFPEESTITKTTMCIFFSTNVWFSAPGFGPTGSSFLIQCCDLEFHLQIRNRV